MEFTNAELAEFLLHTVKLSGCTRRKERSGIHDHLNWISDFAAKHDLSELRKLVLCGRALLDQFRWADLYNLSVELMFFYMLCHSEYIQHLQEDY